MLDSEIVLSMGLAGWWWAAGRCPGCGVLLEGLVGRGWMGSDCWHWGRFRGADFAV